MRRLAAFAIASAFVLTGCASVASAPSAPPTVAATATATDTAPQTSSPPSSEPTPTDAEYGAFGSRDALIETCLSLEKEYVGAPYLSIHTDQARVERRTVAPEWLIYIPAVNDNGDVAVYCILGGTPENIDYVTAGGTLPMAEEEIQRDLTSNDRYRM